MTRSPARRPLARLSRAAALAAVAGLAALATAPAAAAAPHNYARLARGHWYGYARPADLTPDDADARPLPALMMVHLDRLDGDQFTLTLRQGAAAAVLQCTRPCDQVRVTTFTEYGFEARTFTSAPGTLIRAIIEDVTAGRLRGAVTVSRGEETPYPTLPTGFAPATPEPAPPPARVPSTPAPRTMALPAPALPAPAPLPRNGQTQPLAGYSEHRIVQVDPSFHCDDAVAPGRKLICGDIELGQRQVAISRQTTDTQTLVDGAMDAASVDAFVREAEQAQAARDACADRGCLVKWFDQRAAQLSAWDTRARTGGAH